ncbi:asparagine synthase (glutamine-hydrolyzing) [bacterium]|nr:asparagine synthase (glutamine-hydrolyzing) [bacterium]
MCGIAGVVNLRGEPVDPRWLPPMARAMSHRGPDDEGVWSRDNLGLAHRRLSIIDLSARGHQPMHLHASELTIVYNGEIYNFRELRAELRKLGRHFDSASDTEVILHAYHQWGPACVERFNGMFAFALADLRRRVLFLARDRYGVKPLYLWNDGTWFAFASEIKALLTLPMISARLDSAALVEYFTFQNIYGTRTLFAGVSTLPPATTLTLDLSTGAETRRKYWDWNFARRKRALSFEEACREVRDTFEDAVMRQLVSDVEVGSYLSGGMDSGSIAAAASRQIPNLLTFTGGFDMAHVSGLELAFDEREPAEKMAGALGTQHYERVMYSGDMARVLPRVVWHMEDLRAGMCWQNYLVSFLASRFVKVVLGGTGGDESFAGYPWRYAHLLRDAHPREALARYFRYWQRLVPVQEHRDFFTPEVLRHAPDVRAGFDAVLGDGLPSGERWSPDEALAVALAFEARTFLPAILLVEDRVSMAHGLESRVPFLDNEVVDLAETLPVDYLISDLPALVRQAATLDGDVAFSSSQGKYVLRAAMRGLLPEEILERKKQGFSPPDRSWYQGPTMNYIRDVLLTDACLNAGFIRPEAIHRVVDEHVEGRRNHRLLIWSLLCVEWWRRIFLENRSFADLSPS